MKRDMLVLCANGTTIVKPSVSILLAIEVMIVGFQHVFFFQQKFQHKFWMLNILTISVEVHLLDFSGSIKRIILFPWLLPNKDNLNGIKSR